VAYDEAVIVCSPDDPIPVPEHSEEFYNHIELIKKKGRRKKDDPYEYRSIFIPWHDLNMGELMELCIYGFKISAKLFFGVKPGTPREMDRWHVLSRALRRNDLIRIIRGEVDPNEMIMNPTHVARQRLAMAIYSNWRYIHSQIVCNTCCWECPDAKALECVLENRDLLAGEDL